MKKEHWNFKPIKYDKKPQKIWTLETNMQKWCYVVGCGIVYLSLFITAVMLLAFATGFIQGLLGL